MIYDCDIHVVNLIFRFYIQSVDQISAYMIDLLAGLANITFPSGSSSYMYTYIYAHTLFMSSHFVYFVYAVGYDTVSEYKLAEDMFNTEICS